MFVDDESLHPRPQLSRRVWTDLSGSWQFAYDDANCGIQEHWETWTEPFTQTITVPFPPESKASGIGDPSFHAVLWYRRTFEMLREYENKRLILHFGAVDYRASVWVNGHHVASHEGGQTPFYADITNALEEGPHQVIVVRSEDIPGDLGQPRGKQDWQERQHGIWYNRTSGIWQPVWLEPVGDVHVTNLQWTPDIDRGKLGIHVDLSGQSDETVTCRIELSLHDVSLMDDRAVVHGAMLDREVSLDLQDMAMSPHKVLWSPQFPNLIEATISIAVDDVITDVVQSYAGLRSVGVARGRFLLNGLSYYMRLTLEQGYWPESHLALPSVEAARREVELAKELGFNGVRIHQKVEDPRFLYWCDRLGLLVWGEMANAYVFSEVSARRFTREWMDVVRRDYSHPCIVAWVPFNESWGVPNLLQDRSQQHFVQSLYHLTKTLDSTRPVIGNDGWEHIIGDVFGVHDYSFDGQTLRDRYGSLEAIRRTLRDVQPGYRFVSLQDVDTSEPVMITEFGGISYRPDRDGWYGYGTVNTPGEFELKYKELIDAILDSPVVAGFCYTQLADTGQETNGLLDENRVPKLNPDVVRSITHRPSAAVPGDVIRQLQSVSATGFAGTPPQTP